MLVNEYNQILIGELSCGSLVHAGRWGTGNWGIRIERPGLSSMIQESPLTVEIYIGPDEIETYTNGYETVIKTASGIQASGKVSLPLGCSVFFEDAWSIADNALVLTREAKVQGAAEIGFLTSILFNSVNSLSMLDLNIFVPGMLYGTFDNVTRTAIGGIEGYQSGIKDMQIREDRIPAPLCGIHFQDGTSATVFHVAPDGGTTREDATDITGETLIDDRFHFGSIGVSEQSEPQAISLGFWFPGSEGGSTYTGDTFPGGQLLKWRRRYHPLRNGGKQHYQVAFRFGRDEDFKTFCRSTWHWAWDQLEPEVCLHDIDFVRRSQNRIISDHIEYRDGRATIPIVIDPATGVIKVSDAYMGFTGRNIEAAYFLLREAERDQGQAEIYRKQAGEIMHTFMQIQLTPPTSEGFYPDGTWINVIKNQPSLRALSEGARYALKAWRHEKKRGAEHPLWLEWAMGFAEWLLAQERSEHGFPRTWKANTGEIGEDSPQSSYSAIPFLVEVYTISGDARFLEAAERTGDFCWLKGQRYGYFVGGTLDNPTVIDKEAATISLEAYMELYEATKKEKWLERAKVAGDIAETWIYCWQVPMPVDMEDKELEWKKNVSTVGLQLIASGHSLVDAYMAFNVAEYAKLYHYTKEPHYYEVAKILLHNTKNMMAFPEQTHGLVAPGWMQEHWSLAPCRGRGLHQIWLPWVSISHLCGIVALEDFDKYLYDSLVDAKKSGLSIHSKIHITG